MAGADHEARYEVRREAASAVVIAVVVLAALAFLSWRNGWVLVTLQWWSWLVIALPGLDPLRRPLARRAADRLRRHARCRSCAARRDRARQPHRRGFLVTALVETKSDDLPGGQLLVTAAAIWIANVIVFGLCYWDIDDGGPFERARHERSTPDFRFPQDETPEVAPPDWRPRVWDYIFVALTSASAFSPTDTMPLTLKAKLLVGVEEVVSLVLIVLVTARAVSVLGT